MTVQLCSVFCVTVGFGNLWFSLKAIQNEQRTLNNKLQRLDSHPPEACNPLTRYSHHTHFVSN